VNNEKFHVGQAIQYNNHVEKYDHGQRGTVLELGHHGDVQVHWHDSSVSWISGENIRAADVQENRKGRVGEMAYPG
jgi:hypothetical protein